MCAGAYLVAVRGSSGPGRFADALPALGCAAMWALSPIFILRGLEGFDSPMAGLTVGLIVSVIAYAPVLALVRGGDRAWTSVKGSIGVLKLIAGVLVGARDVVALGGAGGRRRRRRPRAQPAVGPDRPAARPDRRRPPPRARHARPVGGRRPRDLRRARTGGRGVTRVIDMHAHAIVPELLREAAPARVVAPARVARRRPPGVRDRRPRGALGGARVDRPRAHPRRPGRGRHRRRAALAAGAAARARRRACGGPAARADPERGARADGRHGRRPGRGARHRAAAGSGARGRGAARAHGGRRAARGGGRGERRRPLPGGRRVRAVLGRGGGDRRARLHPSHHARIRFPGVRRALPVERGRQPARDHGDRGAPRA